MNWSYSNLAEQVPSCWLEESKTQFARSGAHAIFGYKKAFCTQRTICVNATSQTFHVHEYSNVYWCPVPIHGVLNLLPQGSWAAWLGNVYGHQILSSIWKVLQSVRIVERDSGWADVPWDPCQMPTGKPDIWRPESQCSLLADSSAHVYILSMARRCPSVCPPGACECIWVREHWHLSALKQYSQNECL